MNFIYSGGNVLCLDIWGRSSGPYMQGLHFAFGVGAFVAPWVAEPFLSQSRNITNGTDISSNGTRFITSPHLPGEVMRKRGIRDIGLPNTLPTSVLNISSTTAKVKPTRPMVADGSKLHPDYADGKKAGAMIQKNEKESKKTPTVTEKPRPELSVLLNTNCSESGNDTDGCDHIPGLTPLTSTITSATTTTTVPRTTTTTSKTSTSTNVNSNSKSITVTTTSEFPSNNGTPVTPTDSISHHISHTYTIMSKHVNEVINSLSKASTVQFAYIAIALFILVVSLTFLIICCSGKITLRAVKYQDIEPEFMLHRETTGFRVQILILLFIFYFLYVGMEVTYGNLIMSFAVEYLGWSKARGTVLTSVFWGSFAAGRGMAIFLSKCLTPAIMLIGDLVLTNLSLIGLVMALDSNHIMLWFCTATLGVSMASIFPSGISWAETYMQLTGKSTAVLVVGSALGEMSLPALTGFLFQLKSPMFLMYVMLAGAIMCIVVYIIMQNLASNKGERYQRVSTASQSKRFLNNEDDTDLEMDAIGIELDLSENGSTTGLKKRVTFNLHNTKVGNGHNSATITPTATGTVGLPKASILKGTNGATRE